MIKWGIYTIILFSFLYAVVGNEIPKCPICRMDVDDEDLDYHSDWYIEMNYGQKIYTCGMTSGNEPKKTELTHYSHPTRVAYEMLLFIDTTEKACTSICEPCDANRTTSNELKDPMNGKVITKENYHFICLKWGQKIYFESNANKKLYLQNLPFIPYFLIQKGVCHDSSCPDFWQLINIKENESIPQDNNKDDNITEKEDHRLDAHNSFCSGASVMSTGFTFSKGNTCVMYLFQSLILNKEWKYILGILITFLASFMNEGLVYYRHQLRLFIQSNHLSSSSYIWKWRLCNSLLYMIQMTLAYFLMLIVMTYEIFLFASLVIGFGVGFYFFKWKEPTIHTHGNDQDKQNQQDDNNFTSSYCLHIKDMKCEHSCGLKIKTRLLNISGVKNVWIDMNQHVVHVKGYDLSSTILIQSVNDCGYSCELFLP